MLLPLGESGDLFQEEKNDRYSDHGKDTRDITMRYDCTYATRPGLPPMRALL